MDTLKEFCSQLRIPETKVHKLIELQNQALQAYISIVKEIETNIDSKKIDVGGSKFLGIISAIHEFNTCLMGSKKEIKEITDIGNFSEDDVYNLCELAANIFVEIQNVGNPAGTEDELTDDYESTDEEDEDEDKAEGKAKVENVIPIKMGRPDYDKMTEINQVAMKKVFAAKFRFLRQRNPKITIPELDPKLTLNQIQDMYENCVEKIGEEVKSEAKKPEPKVEVKAEAKKPEPKVEVKVESKKPEPKVEVKVEAKKPEPKVEVKVEAKKPEPKVEVKVEVKKPEPKVEVKVEAKKPEPKVEVKVEAKKPEPKVEVKDPNLVSTVPGIQITKITRGPVSSAQPHNQVQSKPLNTIPASSIFTGSLASFATPSSPATSSPVAAKTIPDSKLNRLMQNARIRKIVNAEKSTYTPEMPKSDPKKKSIDDVWGEDEDRQ
jgi:hypothetical protein